MRNPRWSSQPTSDIMLAFLKYGVTSLRYFTVSKMSRFNKHENNEMLTWKFTFLSKYSTASVLRYASYFINYQCCLEMKRCCLKFHYVENYEVYRKLQEKFKKLNPVIWKFNYFMKKKFGIFFMRKNIRTHIFKLQAENKLE